MISQTFPLHGLDQGRAFSKANAAKKITRTRAQKHLHKQKQKERKKGERISSSGGGQGTGGGGGQSAGGLFRWGGHGGHAMRQCVTRRQ